MASILNTWYCLVFTEEDLTNILKPEVLFKGDEPLCIIDYTEGKVKKKLINLKPNSAQGLLLELWYLTAAWKKEWFHQTGRDPMLPPFTSLALKGSQETTGQSA